MKKVAVVLMCMFSMSAMAEGAKSNMYGGVQYAMTTYDETGVEDLNPTALVFVIGNKFNKNFALEGRIGIGMGDDSLSGLPVTLEIDSFVGVYAKGIVPVSSTVDLYGIIGYTDGEVTVSAPGISLSASESDTSLGFGVDFAVSKTTSMNLEYINYIDSNGTTLDAISVGANFAF